MSATETTDAVAYVPANADAFLGATRTDRVSMCAAASAAALVAMTDGDTEAATGHMQSVVWYNAHMTDARTVAPTFTPGQVLARRVATLRLAADLLDEGIVTPDGLGDVDWDDYNDNQLGAQANTPDVARAFTMAAAKVGRGTRSATRNDLTGAIRSAFAGQPVGTVLTVPEIMDAIGCPRDWNGRISARLARLADCTVPGVIGVKLDGGAIAGRSTEAIVADDDEEANDD